MTTKVSLSAVAVMLSVALVSGQTRVTVPANKYTPAQDVELGREAAAEVRQKLPMMRDDAVTSYVEDIGRRLVATIPAEFSHPEFRYTFETVNVREINAFALPGGPMFINRGMIEAASTEGEVAGVMAHELSHVILRHGTAQASKATKYEVGSILGAIAGAVIGGRVGSVVAQGAQFGFGTYFLKFGRQFERDADIGGAQIMARAGYDPRQMANMFRTIEKQGGSGGPEWLSDHPNPGNRVEYINKEAQSLRVQNPVQNTQGFERVRAHLRSLSPAPTTEQATRTANKGGSSAPRAGSSRPTGRVTPPSSKYTEYNEGDIFRVSVPSNWRELSGSSAVTFAPEGAFGDQNGQNVFTHGVQMGIARNETHDLDTATGELIESLAEGNPRLTRATGGYRRASVDGRPGLQTTLENVSEVTGRREVIQLVTAEMRDGNLFYMIGVAPEDDVRAYEPAFQRIARSIRFAR
jgi:Zn-dependent protease with chaperone function